MKEKFEARWGSLSDREKKISMIAAACLLLFFIYSIVWNPLSTQLKDNEKKLLIAQQTLTWVEDKAGILVQSGIGKQTINVDNLNLVESINMSAKKLGVNFSRVDNKKDQVEVAISDVEFDIFINWLTILNQQYSITVINADFVKGELEGHVKVNRLLLSR